MKLKNRFTFSNLIMLLVPIALIGIISIITGSLFVAKYSKYFFSAENGISEAMENFFELLKTNPTAIHYIIFWVLVCIIVIFSVNAIINYKLSNSIINPIVDMTKAVKKIKDGDYSFEILGSEYLEINELSRVVNEMRQSLKESRDNEDRLKKERNLMLAHLSHDLKTPITGIRSYAEGISDGVAKTPEQVKSYLNTIIAKTKVIEGLSNNLSEYSHMELDHVEFTFAKGDIIDFLNEIILNYQNDFKKKSLKLTSSVPSCKFYVKADFDRLFRVFSNLLDNVLKYSRPDSVETVITAQISDEGIFIIVADDGIGINKDKLKNVFEDFFRVNSARTMNVSGNGLGLSIARQIVEKHSGKIWLKNNENNGTTAVVYLPKYL